MGKKKPIPNLDLLPLHFILQSFHLPPCPISFKTPLHQKSTYYLCIMRVVPYEHKRVILGGRRGFTSNNSI